jgi:anaphase-promoting complex subunit 3
VRLLLAESYLGEGKAYKAYDVLRGCSSGPNRYKLALTCIKLNRLADAEKVLLDQNNIRALSLMDPEQLKKVPNGAAGLFLLGQVRELQSKWKEAIKNYRQALKLDPSLWCAFERLCVLTPDEIDPTKMFTRNHPFI